MIDGTGTSSYSYDPFNELTSYENGAGNTVSYSYDADGNTTGITYPLGAGATWATTDTVSYGYDNADELNSVTDFNGNSDHGRKHRRRAAELARARLERRHDQHQLRPDRHPVPDHARERLDAAAVRLQRRPLRRDRLRNRHTILAGSPAAYTYDAQNRVTQMTPGRAAPSPTASTPPAT